MKNNRLEIVSKRKGLFQNIYKYNFVDLSRKRKINNFYKFINETEEYSIDEIEKFLIWEEKKDSELKIIY